MAEKKVVLEFPAALVGTPVASRLVSEHGLEINILRADIEPDQAGHLALALTGEPGNIRKALEYVEGLGIRVASLEEDVNWDEERCTSCTACVSVCPTGALSVERSSMDVSFDGEKCIACGLCIPVCPYDAVEVAF